MHEERKAEFNLPFKGLFKFDDIFVLQYSEHLDFPLYVFPNELVIFGFLEFFYGNWARGNTQ